MDLRVLNDELARAVREAERAYYSELQLRLSSGPRHGSEATREIRYALRGVASYRV